MIQFHFNTKPVSLKQTLLCFIMKNTCFSAKSTSRKKKNKSRLTYAWTEMTPVSKCFITSAVLSVNKTLHHFKSNFLNFMARQTDTVARVCSVSSVNEDKCNRPESAAILPLMHQESTSICAIVCLWMYFHFTEVLWIGIAQCLISLLWGKSAKPQVPKYFIFRHWTADTEFTTAVALISLHSHQVLGKYFYNSIIMCNGSVMNPENSRHAAKQAITTMQI